jgi:hypothetical protein
VKEKKMSKQGYFEYSNRIRISLEIKQNGEINYYEVTKHEQLDYEELCYEHMQPEVFSTLNSLEANDKFARWVSDFLLTLLDRR